MNVFQTLNTWKIIHWAVYDNISNKSMTNNAGDTRIMSGYEQCYMYSVQTVTFSVDIAVSSHFSFSTRAGHGAKGDPWRNYMGKGKLEIGGMVIRISVQYRDAAECNIATDQAKLVHFSAGIGER